MNIIFTYCNVSDRKGKPSEFTLNSARLSSGSVKKFTDYKTVLYVDTMQYMRFKDMPYFDEIIKVDYFEDNFDIRYWNYPKLKTYSLQTSPFLHMDLDVCVLPGFSIQENYDIITEKIRNIGSDTKCFRHAFLEYPKPLNISCSGILGCNTIRSLDAFKTIYEKAKLECVNGVNKEVSFPDLYSIEEVAFKQLIDNLNLSCTVVPVSKFIHFQGANKVNDYSEEILRLLKNFKL